MIYRIVENHFESGIVEFIPQFSHDSISATDRKEPKFNNYLRHNEDGTGIIRKFYDYESALYFINLNKTNTTTPTETIIHDIE